MKSKGTSWRAAVAAVAAAVVGLGAAHPSDAKVVYEGPAAVSPSSVRGGGNLKAGPGGPAWKAPRGGEDYGAFHGVVVDLGAAGVRRLPQGTLEVWVERDEQEGSETLLTFVDGEFQTLAPIDLLWGDENSATVAFAPGHGYLLWQGTYVDQNTGLEGRQPVVSLGRAVGQGSRLHLVMTWGPSPSECAVYANGRRVATYWAEDFAMARLIDDTRYLVIGSVPMSGSAAGPTSAGNMSRSAVGPVRLHDTVLTAAELSRPPVSSVAAERGVYGGGQEIVVTLRGGADGVARFTLAGVFVDVAMEEVDDGVYVGRAAAPAGLSGKFFLTATLTSLESGASASVSGGEITLDGEAPSVPGRILATVPYAGEIELGWTASASADTAHYLVFRGEGKAPDLGAAPVAEVKGLSLVDTAVVPGLTYHYAVVAVDRAGNRSALSEVVSVKAVAGEGPAISGISVEPFGKPVRPGQAVALTAIGPSGGRLTVDLGELAAGLVLAEQGRSGRYEGSYTVKDADVGPTKTLHRVVAKLTDAFGSSTLAGPEVAIVGLDALNDHTAPVIAKASHDGFQVAGFSGTLVAGDVVTVTLEGERAAYGSFDVGAVAKNVAMIETKPGVYQGTYTVGWKDEGTNLAVVARLADDAGNEATQPVGRPVDLDTRVRLAVTAKDAQLPADKKSTTRLVAKATNANGDEVSGHELALTLSTTGEYTGVVGGGRLEGRTASKDDEDDLEVKWGGVTSAFGEVAATYTAGFAAKTALVIAKNLTTGDVGAGWLNTYVASTVALEVVPRAGRGAVDRAVLTATAEPPWLTADGRSTSRVKVALADLSGNPVKGAKVAFALGNQNGRLKILRGTTDDAGLAEAEYRAGTMAGEVTVTVSAADWGVARSLQLELRADAPAKIDLTASAARVVAGDQATLAVRVTDINDNPNIGAPVTFAVLQGGGSVAAPAILTDRHGAGRATYRAGNTAGLAIVEARHTSRAPTQVELQRIQGTIFVPRLAERQERDRVKVAEWLVKAGKEVEKGQALVVLEGGKGTWTLTAPEKGVLVRHVKHKRDVVELGDTLGYVEIDEGVWGEEYGK